MSGGIQCCTNQSGNPIGRGESVVAVALASAYSSFGSATRTARDKEVID